MVWDEHRTIGHSLNADSIRRECEASLRRLRVDAIDLYQIHWPNPDQDIEEGWATMAALKSEGKVRNIGVSNFSVAQMKRAQAIAPITSLQPRYSLLHREVEPEILPFVAKADIGVIAYSPMASGLLTGAMTRERIAALPADDWRRAHEDFREPQLSRNLDAGEPVADDRQAPRALAGRGRGRLGAGQSGGDRRDRRRPASRPDVGGVGGATSASAPGNAPRSTAFC